MPEAVHFQDPWWVALGGGSVDHFAESNKNELIVISFVLEDVAASSRFHVLPGTSKEHILLAEFFEPLIRKDI